MSESYDCAYPFFQNRIIHWAAGVKGKIPDFPVAANLGKYRPAADAKTDDSEIINRVIAETDAPGTILIPEGTYLLKSRLVLKNGIILRGEGSPRSPLLIFDVPDKCRFGAISIAGTIDDEEIPILEGAVAGSHILLVSLTNGLKSGATIWVFCDNDAQKMYTRQQWNVDWAVNSVGQMVEVTRIDGNKVEIDVPLRLSYKKTLRPRFRVLHPITNAGVENLHIKRFDKAEDFIIRILYAKNCWVRNCEAEYCMKAHAWVSQSRFITIEGNYMHHAHNYGGGGHGYGVVVGESSSDCLVTNNIFRSLRHSMMTKQGSNGNVFSYNYSAENKLFFCDASIHGHYSYMNLFEGNVVRFITYADYWGPTGPLTTCFRNRVFGKGIVVKDHSHQANIVGNTILRGGIRIDRSVVDCLVNGNFVRGGMTWHETEENAIPASIYLTRPPDFWGDKPWPCIGADVDTAGKLLTIPAEDRYNKYR